MERGGWGGKVGGLKVNNLEVNTVFCKDSKEVVILGNFISNLLYYLFDLFSQSWFVGVFMAAIFFI